MPLLGLPTPGISCSRGYGNSYTRHGRYRGGFMTLSPALLYSSPLWFLDGEGISLSSSSYGESTVDTMVYVVRAVGV
jgi:hypothetical protein